MPGFCNPDSNSSVERNNTACNDRENALKLFYFLHVRNFHATSQENRSFEHRRLFISASSMWFPSFKPEFLYLSQAISTISTEVELVLTFVNCDVVIQPFPFCCQFLPWKEVSNYQHLSKCCPWHGDYLGMQQLIGPLPSTLPSMGLSFALPCYKQAVRSTGLSIS